MSRDAAPGLEAYWAVIAHALGKLTPQEAQALLNHIDLAVAVVRSAARRGPFANSPDLPIMEAFFRVIAIGALVEISRGNRITPHGIEGPGSSLN